MFSKFTVGTALLASVLLAGPANAAINFVQNGSFEIGTDPGVFTTLGTGSTNIANWSVTGSIDYIGTYWQPADGNRSLDLNGSYAAGTVTQTITGLTSGRTYNVSFSLAGNPDGSPATKQIFASAGGMSQVFSFPLGANTRASMGWMTESFSFVATGSSAVVSFGPFNDPGGAFGPALDDVSVTAAVPEPATWAMMLVGFLGLGRGDLPPELARRLERFRFNPVHIQRRRRSLLPLVP